MTLKNSSDQMETHLYNAKVIHTAGLIVYQNKQLLLAFSKHKSAWYLPGGKIDPEESPLEALIREIQEELCVTLLKTDLTPLFHITAPAFGEKEGIIMEQDCFQGPSALPYKASSEIGELRYFSLADYMAQSPIVPGVITAFEKLQAAGLAANTR